MKYQFQNVSLEKLNQGMDAIAESGGNIQGSNFTIKGVYGSFAYIDGELIIKVQGKPWFATWVMIEKKLNQFFK